MSSIELKPCPFCGGAVNIKIGPYKGTVMFSCQKCGADVCFYGAEHEPKATQAWNRRADNKPIRQSCKSCKHYTPDPSYRNGDMGNCRYLEKIWKKPFYVNEARAECEHYQAAERINENGNET